MRNGADDMSSDPKKAAVINLVFGLFALTIGVGFIVVNVNGTRPIGIVIAVLGAAFTVFAALAVVKARRRMGHH